MGASRKDEQERLGGVAGPKGTGYQGNLEGEKAGHKPVRQIAVHDGPFHGDDVLAVALLRFLYPEAEVIRTRKEDELHRADLRVDVGGKADARAGEFDHHFNNSPKRPNGATFAAAGLVWDYYGEMVLASFGEMGPICFPDLKNFLDEIFFEDLDRLDTGQGGATEIADEVSWALCAMTPTWQEITQEEGLENKRFVEAVQNVHGFLKTRLKQITVSETLLEVTNLVTQLKSDIVIWGAPRRLVHARAAVAAEALVVKAVGSSESGIAVMEFKGMPWQPSIHKAEEVTGKTIFHVIEKAGEEKFMLTAVATEKGGFVSRVYFPECWGGLRGPELVKESGLPGSVFCHPGRWCSGWGSLEEAKHAARLTRAAEMDGKCPTPVGEVVYKNSHRKQGRK